MDPQEVQGIRSDIGTVGVVLAPYPSQVKFVMPARGWWGGVKKGFVTGASTSVAIGVVAPVPGGTLIGVIVAPFAAVAGSVYGAVKALPAKKVDETEAAINEAVVKLKAMNLRGAFVTTVLKTGNERTGWKFVHLPDIGPQAREEIVNYDQLEIPGIDSILEIRIETSGLVGRFHIDPPTSAFVEIRSRLIRVSDNKILVKDILSCESEERTFVQWSEDGGHYFIDAFRSCVPPLAEKVVDDFFLVRPIPAR